MDLHSVFHHPFWSNQYKFVTKISLIKIDIYVLLQRNWRYLQGLVYGFPPIIEIYHSLNPSSWFWLLWFYSWLYFSRTFLLCKYCTVEYFTFEKLLIFNQIHLRMTNKVWWIVVVLDINVLCWGAKRISFEIACPRINPLHLVPMYLEFPIVPTIILFPETFLYFFFFSFLHNYHHLIEGGSIHFYRNPAPPIALIKNWYIFCNCQFFSGRVWGVFLNNYHILA